MSEDTEVGWQCVIPLTARGGSRSTLQVYNWEKKELMFSILRAEEVNRGGQQGENSVKTGGTWHIHTAEL